MSAIDLDFNLRALQKKILSGMPRFMVAVCHRRFGKTLMAIYWLFVEALYSSEDGVKDFQGAYIAPTYRQAKKVSWKYLKGFVFPLLPFGAKINESELYVQLPNGAVIYLFGSDNPDSLRGIYLDRCVLDEVAQMPPSLFTEVIRPALSDRMGKCLFIGTPKGENAFYDYYEKASKSDNEDWGAVLFKASQTGLIPQAELDAAKRDMGENLYAQEYECSFTAAIEGAYYGSYMEKAEKDGRICHVPYDPAVPVDTYWDIGISDSTVIWFAQNCGNEIHLIDFHEQSGVGLEAYVGLLQQKQAQNNWVYGSHNFPHDVRARELGTGLSREETLKNFGVNPNVVSNIGVDDGIQATRNILSRCWFDQKKCKHGIRALKLYRTEWDDKRMTFRNTPFHDWTSHAADAFRMLAVTQKSLASRPTPDRYATQPPRSISWITV